VRRVTPARVALWVASIGALGLLARSLWMGPVSTEIASLAFGGYLGLAALGIAFPRWQMFGDAWTHVPTAGRRVALTFDDGPDPRTTREILAVLERYGARASFFVIGNKVALFPEVAREIHAAGHVLGVHGHVHAWLHALGTPSAVAKDIERARDAVMAAAGVRPRWFRPPLGIVSPRTAAGARRAGVEIVLWSVKARDGWRSTEPSRALERLLAGVEDGAILLLHDAAEGGDFVPASVALLPRLLEELARRGYSAVGLDELLGEPAYVNLETPPAS
jgi:peptidoglycan/xylan/chitin deacetylase (PgdA/CDA1 family)